MRKFILVILLTLCFNNLLAQDIMEDYTYVSDNIIEQTYGLPTVRTVGGGTKIIVSYQGDWSEDMKSAFEYACKIWEEAMPTTFPIHVLAVLDDRKNTTALSKVTALARIHTQDVFSYHPTTNMSTWLQIKGTTMSEFLGLYDTEIYKNVLTTNMFFEDDIKVTYFNKGNKIKDNCSFSLSENIDKTKYDFVTLVLRDLAKGFGVIWQYNNPNLWPDIINENKITAYEKCVLNSLGYWETEASQLSMYAKATQGSLEISDNNETWTVYAPTKWDMNKSLSTFIPNNKQKISNLLTHEFGKGSIIRDIYDAYTSIFFEYLLSWKGDVAVGVENTGTITKETKNTNDKVIGYNGSISLTSPRVKDAYKAKALPQTQNYVPWNTVADSIRDIMMKYHPNYNGTNNFSDMGTISLLLNDGTWDIVYTFPSNFNISVSVSDFTLHYANKDYARTTDGYLRCRISKTEYQPSRNAYRVVVKYYALDYLPQVVVMAKSKVKDSSVDEFYSDIEIGYKNIEGTTRIVVSQYDDGEDVPFQFVLSDIKSGKFAATVDNEYPTRFVITSYNKNGTTDSETYIYNPQESASSAELSFAYSKGSIKVASNSKRFDTKELIESFTIKRLGLSLLPTPSVATTLTNDNLASCCIDISKLAKGLYLLEVLDVYGKSHHFKFSVK